MRKGLAFGAVAAVIIFGGAGVVSLLQPGTELARAVWTSAFLAFGVQLVAFAVARPFVATNPLGGWGLGSLVRFAVLLVYALVGAKLLGLEMAPALVSFAGFLFVTMLVETLFLKS